MVKVIVIDPAAREVCEADIGGRGHNLVPAIHALIGKEDLDHTSAPSSVFDVPRMGLFVYGWGHYDDDWPFGFALAGYKFPLIGTAVVYREAGTREQEPIDHGLDLDEVRRRISWLRKVPNGPRDRLGIQQMEKNDG